MKFIDEATIAVQAGDGGNGCVSFRREKFVPKGGPDGGDGGKGGDIQLFATLRKRTLHHFHFKHQFKAPNGGHGQGRQKTGRGGEPLQIDVPPGTLVSDADTGELLVDLAEAGQTYVAARGGRGGAGNIRFKSSINRTPRYAKPGEAGEIRTLRLELKLIADIGIIGLPNAGKSTLISRMSSSRPKIADYPFTTLVPNLGVVALEHSESFVVADIPGLIEGAHKGVGLGTRFLRHVERTRALVHLIDASQIDPADPLSAYETVNRELSLYSRDLANKPQVVVLNKTDLPNTDEKCRLLSTASATEPLKISAATGSGVDRLIGKLISLLESTDEH
ncbi:MAG: GTPase ObgE [Desulfobacterales bacterium]